MEPSLPAPNPEALPPVPVPPAGGAEVAPNVAPEASHEAIRPAPLAPPAPPSSVAVSPAATPVNPVPDPAQAIDDTALPQIADDVDLIEKEWVDKAKKIVSSTKHDPYEQEKQVSHLQADYLMKRYNKQIKVPE